MTNYHSYLIALLIIQTAPIWAVYPNRSNRQPNHIASLDSLVTQLIEQTETEPRSPKKEVELRVTLRKTDTAWKNLTGYEQENYPLKNTAVIARNTARVALANQDQRRRLN